MSDTKVEITKAEYLLPATTQDDRLGTGFKQVYFYRMCALSACFYLAQCYLSEKRDFYNIKSNASQSGKTSNYFWKNRSKIAFEKKKLLHIC